MRLKRNPLNPWCGMLGMLILTAGFCPGEEVQVKQEQIEALQQARPQRQLNINQIRNMGEGVETADAGVPRNALQHVPFHGPLTANKIQVAIDDACLFLRTCQNKDGWFTGGSDQDGDTALATLTLLAAGGDPASDEAIRKALDWQLTRQPNNTYVRGLRANVWEYALRKTPYETRYRDALKADYDWLLKALGNKEGWRYNMTSSDWDNSVTQYGVLGIWAAARAGFDPGLDFWKRMSAHFQRCQTRDGGWTYTGGGPDSGGGTPNMATAGLASLFLVFDMYHGKACYSAQAPNVFENGEAAACLSAIQRGMGWLGKNHQNGWADGYFLYGMERAGVASGRKYIGGVDWFKQGALSILRAQGPNGSIGLGHWGGLLGSTSFCTLFLVYGGAPVAFNKLEYGDGQDWNLNPRDLANLSKYLWSAYERPLNWHAVSIAAEPEEFEAPVLFISGAKAARFSDQEVAKLRTYIQRGGTILAEPSDRSAAFATSMEQLVQQLFPEKEYPDRKLESLAATHGLYTVLKQDWKKRPALRGVSDGARTVFILSDGYLSGEWQTDTADSDAFRLGLNLLFYATDMGIPAAKYATGMPDTAVAKPRKTALTVARIKPACAQGTTDWNASPLCWQQFAPYLEHVAGSPLDEKPAVELSKSDLKGLRLLHLTGRTDFTLSAEERAALKGFVEKGGTLLVDSSTGSTAFTAAARREIEAALGTLAPLDPSSFLANGQFEGGNDLTRGLQLKLLARKALRKSGQTSTLPLDVWCLGKRPAVLFSRFDLSAAMAGIENYKALAWKPDSARRIVGNLTALITAE